MTEYMPKVGDRVRATLGENVLVGTVQCTDQDYTEVAVSDGRSWMAVWHHDGWQFEQVVEVPTKFGAVIRNNDGRLFTLADLTPTSQEPWVELLEAGRRLRYEWASTATATEGGFTVLFEGVDE